MSTGLLQQLLIAIVVIGFIASDGRLSREIEGLLLQRLGIAVRAGRQKKLNGLSLSGDHEVDF